MNTGKKRFNTILSAALALCMVLALLPGGPFMTALADTVTHDISDGSLNAVKGNDYIVIQSGSDTSNSIVVARDYDGVITLSGVNITAAAPIEYAAGAGDPTASYTIELDGANTLTVPASAQAPAIPLRRGATITIRAKNSTDEDSLNTNGNRGPGIGARGFAAGALVIESGTINAYGGGNNNVGIGVAESGCGDTLSVTINGGEVNASATKAGIGSGGGSAHSPLGRIVINGGDVNATGGWGASAIGAAHMAVGEGKINEIIINGGNINAIGGANAPGIGFASTSPALSTPTGTIVITGGNIIAKGGGVHPGIGAYGAYSPTGNVSCLETLVVLPGANIARKVPIGLAPPEDFTATVTGVAPLVGNARYMFYMNSANLTSVGEVGKTAASLVADTPHTNINVFADFSDYHVLLDTLIKAAYASRGDAVPSSVIDMGITNTSGDIQLYYYNTMPVSGTQIKFSGSGCTDKIMADTTDIASGTVTLANSSAAVATATPTPGPTAPPPPSDNAKLAALRYITSFGSWVTVPGFLVAQDGMDNQYTVPIPEGKSAVYVEAPPAHGKATSVVSPQHSIPIIDGTGTATVTVTAQDGITTSEYIINFVSVPVTRTEDVIHFNDSRAGTSSGSPGTWNSTSTQNNVGGTEIVMNAPNPAGGAYPASTVKLSGNGAYMTKSWLDLSDEFAISTTVYIPPTGAASTNINFADATLMTIDGISYTFDTARTIESGWRRLDLHIIPGEGATPMDRWSGTVVKLYIDGVYIAQRACPITSYAQTVLGGNGYPMSGWGHNASRFEFRLTSAGEFWFDELCIYEPGDFTVIDAVTERHNDLAQNVKLNGKVTLKLSRDIDIGTCELDIYEDGELITRPVTIDSLNPKNIVIDFSGAGNAMKQYTMYAFILNENCTDVTGRRIMPESAAVTFATGGLEGTTPAKIATITPEEGAKYVMPDEFNTGYYSVEHFSEFKTILEKYPQLIAGGDGQVRITKASIEALKAANNPYLEERDGKTVFSGFKLDGRLQIEASDVIVEDFYIDSQFGRYVTNVTTGGGAKNVVVQDGELTRGDGAAVAGDNITLRRMHIHHIMADGLKPSSNWLIESCYLHDFGLAYLAHADGAQISGSRGGLTNNIRMYGNRIDMPPVPYINVSNATVILKLDFGPLTNTDIQYNWFNGGGQCTYLMGMDYLLKDLTYKNNLIGVGYRWSHPSAPSGTNLVDNVVERGIELQDLNIPSAGSVVYKDEDGNRIYDLADAGDKLTIMANFANFTTNEQNVKIVAELYDIDDRCVATASPAVTPIQRYTPIGKRDILGAPQDYYVSEAWKFVYALRDYIVENVNPEFTLGTGGDVENRNYELSVYYNDTKDYVENVLNKRDDLKVTAEWRLVEGSDTWHQWFIGLKERPYLPLSEQRGFEFNLTRPAEAGDYVKVSVYKVWGGDTPDELLRPADTLMCSLEPSDVPKLSVSNPKITKSGTYSISANVKNTFDTAKNVNFVVAVYSLNKLVDVQIILQPIEAGRDDVLSFVYTPISTLQATNTVKVMVWDANQSPLCAAYEKVFGAIAAD